MAGAVNAYEATLVGGELPGDYKWNGDALAADGYIYGIPYNATQVLSVAVVKAAAPVAVVKEHVPGEDGVSRAPRIPRSVALGVAVVALVAVASLRAQRR